MRNLQERAIAASMEYLEGKGYENVERFEDVIVADHDGDKVFLDVKVSDGSFGGTTLPDENERDEMEQLAMRYLAECEECGFPVRFDKIVLVVIREDRAFLRHYVNALGIAG